MEDKDEMATGVERVIRRLEVLSMAVPGTKLNGKTQLWDQSWGIMRYFRGDSKEDIQMMLKAIVDELSLITGKEELLQLRPKIKNAIVGLDSILTTYSQFPHFVEQIQRYTKLIKEYL